MDLVAASIGTGALLLSIYNTLETRRRHRSEAAKDEPDLRVVVVTSEDGAGEVSGVQARVSNKGHRPIEIRRYWISDRHGDALDVAAVGGPALPATLGVEHGFDFFFDLDDLQEASQRAQLRPHVFRVCDAHGISYEADFPRGF